jgi:formylglycine-generating enzyme required for sulfatase activity
VTRAAVAFALGWLAGCAVDVAPPRPQAIVYVDTDAPVPRLTDRLRIRVLRDTGELLPVACDGCARDLALDETTSWPISFGIAPPEDGARTLVEATLYPSGRVGSADLDPATSARHAVEIRFGDAIVAQELFVSFACAGITTVPGSTCDATGAVVPVAAAPAHTDGATSRLGTFRAEHARTCAAATGADEVCVAGNTYWMGDARRRGFGAFIDAVPEHAVTVSPFLLDRFEYTVARYRAALDAGFTHGGRGPLVRETPGNEPCNWSATDTSRDDHPPNCIDVSLAIALCAHEGKRLPTEAEWEWAAGSRENETLYPWGNSRPTCSSDPGANCWPESGLQTRPVGALVQDVTSDGVHDMSMDVAELLDDFFQKYTEPCWTPGAYGPDPRCDPPLEQPVYGRNLRGGHHAPGDAAGYVNMIGSRSSVPAGAFAAHIGFRCARADGP